MRDEVPPTAVSGGLLESFEAGKLRAAQHVAEMLVEVAIAEALDTRYAAAAGTACFGRLFHR